jgi:hypothetical protein
MDMVKDEVIQKDRLSVIQESLLGFIPEEVVQPRRGGGGFCLGTTLVGLESLYFSPTGTKAPLRTSATSFIYNNLEPHVIISK